MRDPHIERLHYEAGSGSDNISYRTDAAPLAFSNAVGKFDLREGRLVVEPAEHFADEESAKQVVDTFLRAWEIDCDLTDKPGQIRFKFKRSEMIDRDPPPPDKARNITSTGAIRMGVAVINATVTFACTKYPDPPTAFAATVDVQRAHTRWQRYREGKEPLQSMAYFVLTVVLALGGQRQAAQTLAIEVDVLRKFGELSSVRGNAETARKAPKSAGPYQDLSGQEKAWLEAAVRKVIRRLGEHAAGKASRQLTLADLPRLP